MVLRLAYGNHIDNDDFQKTFRDGGLMGHVDMKRLRDGLSGGAFWSVWAPCPEDDNDFTDENYIAGEPSTDAVLFVLRASLMRCLSIPSCQIHHGPD